MKNFTTLVQSRSCQLVTFIGCFKFNLADICREDVGHEFGHELGHEC